MSSGPPRDRVPPVLLAGLGRNRQVRLFGVDLPSVDQVDSRTLPIHHALGAANITILENLDLRAVPAGCYDLIALPLRLAGADGSPVRAVLIELEAIGPRQAIRRVSSG